jgi:hypothetical protein
MSWHCLYCGNSEDCNGLVELFDIRGGIPKRLCCHLSCFVKSLPDYDSVSDVKEEIMDWDRELYEETKFVDEKSEGGCIADYGRHEPGDPFCDCVACCQKEDTIPLDIREDQEKDLDDKIKCAEDTINDFKKALSERELFLTRRLKYIEKEIKGCLKSAEKVGDNKEALGYKTALCIVKNSESKERMDYDDEIEAKKNKKNVLRCEKPNYKEGENVCHGFGKE